MRVLIRADASPTIGSGHIARCLTLARVLRKQGAHVAFACRLLPGHRLDSLASEGFETFALPDRYRDEDPQQAIESMLPWQADIAALAQALEGHAGFRLDHRRPLWPRPSLAGRSPPLGTTDRSGG